MSVDILSKIQLSIHTIDYYIHLCEYVLGFQSVFSQKTYFYLYNTNI